MDQPFDHNGECTFCDEPGMHRADCPWLLQLLAEVEDLRAKVEYLQQIILDENEHPR
jgi:hypothetical protein